MGCVVALCSLPLTAVADTFNYSGGCFGALKQTQRSLKGVSEVISGFTGGTTPSPRYESGKWGDHREAAQIIYDPTVISYEELVKYVMPRSIMRTMKVSFAIEAGPTALRFISKQKKSVWQLSGWRQKPRWCQ